MFLSEVSGKNNKLKKCEGKLTNNRIMVWTCFKSEQRQNYSKGYSMRVKRKCPRGRPSPSWEQLVRKESRMTMGRN